MYIYIYLFIYLFIYYIKWSGFSATNKIDSLTCVDYHETHWSCSIFALFLWGNRTIFYIINRTIHGCLEI